jgi:hypothetical protein
VTTSEHFFPSPLSDHFKICATLVLLSSRCECNIESVSCFVKQICVFQSFLWIFDTGRPLPSDCWWFNKLIMLQKVFNWIKTRRVYHFLIFFGISNRTQILVFKNMVFWCIRSRIENSLQPEFFVSWFSLIFLIIIFE